jgi:methyltransferase
MWIAPNISWTGIFLGLLFLFLIRKLWDQAVSWKNIRNLKNHGHVHSAAGGFPLLFATHVAFFILVPTELLWFRRPFDPVLGSIMIAMFVLASLLRSWSKRILGEHWNSQVVVANDMTPVVRGPYRIVRHPNYLAMCLELITLSLAYSTYISAVVVALLCLVAVLVRIRCEEQSLMQIPAYQEAMSGKARLIPGIYEFADRVPGAGSCS